MCGIAGIIYRDRNRRVEQPLLTSMRDLLTHRGPDEAGVFVDGPVGLAHRRLSIIDLSSGQQPMSTECGRATIVFNGEIYNYRELRESLNQRGVKFRTQSDTEVILQLYAELGESSFSLLNGIFAFSIWDAPRRRLVLARDRLGIKPLYYARDEQGLAFASEIKSLFRSGIVSARLDAGAVPEYFLFRSVAGERTLFEGVRSLLPGHFLIVSAEGASLQRYAPNRVSQETTAFQSFETAVDRLDEVLQSAISRQMVSDVPLGTFCSGGIDSSLVTAIASKHSREPINTYSVGFDEPEFDESQFAEAVSRHCRTRHHRLNVCAEDFAALLPDLIWQYDQPLNFANSIQIFALSKLAKEEVTVVLTGEGADELFGGYPRYYIPRLLQIYDGMPRPLRALARWTSRSSSDHRVAKLSSLLDGKPADSLLVNTAHDDQAELVSMYRGHWPHSFAFRAHLVDDALASGVDPVSALTRLDLATHLSSILERQDKMSMAASVEARVPFLDNEVVDFAHTLPMGFKLSLRGRKRILKQVARRYLPVSVIERSKSGFGVPLAQWMRRGGALHDATCELIDHPLLTEFFDAGSLATRVTAHHELKDDRSDFLWTALNFVMWRERFGV